MTFVVVAWDNDRGTGTIAPNAIEITRNQLAPEMDGVCFVGEYVQRTDEGYTAAERPEYATQGQ